MTLWLTVLTRYLRPVRCVRIVLRSFYEVLYFSIRSWISPFILELIYYLISNVYFGEDHVKYLSTVNFFKFVSILCMYISLCLQVYKRPEESIGSSRSWELNSGPPYKLHVLLITEPFLKLPFALIYTHSVSSNYNSFLHCENQGEGGSCDCQNYIASQWRTLDFHLRIMN